MNKTFVIKLLAAVTASVAASAASAAYIRLTGDMSGPADGTNSPGTGTVLVELDTTAHTLHVLSSFQGLVPVTAGGQPSGTTASHIHCCTVTPLTGTAGVATTTPTFAGFPLGVTQSTVPFDQTYNTLLSSSWNAAFIASTGSILNAEATLASGLLAGRTYFNIHTTAFPGGEIRSFLVATQAVPEPGTLALFALGLGALAIPGLKRRR